MKIIRFDAFTESSSDLSPKSFFTENAFLMADSSIRPHRRPLFVPEEGFWLCDLRPAVKISQLGKNISREFASRYYTEFTVVNYMLREPDPEQFFTPGFMLDDAIVCGQWIPLADGPIAISVEGVKDDVLEKHFEFPSKFVDNAISALSENATFKTGDVIVLPHSFMRYVPRRNSHVKVMAKGAVILDFKIK